MRGDEVKDGAAVGRGDGYPALAGLQVGVEGQLEAELIQVKSQASFLIANENVDGVNAEVWLVVAAYRRR